LFQPVLDALKELGGSGKPAEVRDLLAASLSISDEALEVTKQGGAQLFLDRVQWARLYLAKTGYIGSSKRGVWSLTVKGSCNRRYGRNPRHHLRGQPLIERET
jgi:restriction system protein